VVRALGLYSLAAVAEIAGCFAFWAWLRLGRAPAWLLPGMAALIIFAWALTRIDTAFAGRALMHGLDMRPVRVTGLGRGKRTKPPGRSGSVWTFIQSVRCDRPRLIRLMSSGLIRSVPVQPEVS
jgi:hypothetical protein